MLMYRRSLYNPLKFTAMVFAIVALAGCRDEITTTDKPGSGISFGSNLAEGSRAEATPLSNFVQSFRVYGIDGNVENGTFEKKDVVFPNYVVKWSANSANTTQSNSSGWEYVGQDDAALQTIKYWDETKDCHYFWAVADKDKGTFTDLKNSASNVSSLSCNLSADANTASNGALYYSDICKVVKENYGKTVVLHFHPYLSRVRIGFYETLKRYSIKGLEITSISSIVGYGTTALTYKLADNSVETKMTPGDPIDGKDTFGSYTGILAETSEAPSYLGNGFVSLLPWETRNEPLTLTCNYTMVKNGVETRKENAKATVATAYCQWKPGYEYTYVFKILDEEGNIEVDVDIVAIKNWEDYNTDHPIYNW